MWLRKVVAGSALCFVAFLALDIALRPSSILFQEGAEDPFLNPETIAQQQYASTELARALISCEPIHPGHCLILPKRRVERFEDLTSEELVEMGYLVRRSHEATQSLLGPCDYILVQKNGWRVGQNVAHVHWHYVPREQNQHSFLIFSLGFIWPFHKKLRPFQVIENSDEMKRAMAALPSFVEQEPSLESSS